MREGEAALLRLAVGEAAKAVRVVEAKTLEGLGLNQSSVPGWMR